MTLSKDQIGSLVFLCLSLSYGYYAGQIPLLPGDEFEPFHAQTLPYALAGLGALFSFLLLASSSMAGSRSEAKSSNASLDFSLVAKLLALIVLFAIALQWIGFLLATTMFLIGGYWLLGERRPKVLILASLPFAAGIWGVLTQLLNIYLAPGQLLIMVTGG
ncbi:tripartite tricarboxylate transporter TctB family protein [Endozoicomonas elysicola]|uniref:TctB n=1 Tax=Endozoicomonas elysicola TaxID=305900 RepID=A0A081K7Z6_9GAMM|nr:tripartite tricarboxylate transporter TctB family protein [Endozoicomonas elysicola]KEI70272.1 TctB [Endozoicomonas elysicola]